jgi:hypothetical protein
MAMVVQIRNNTPSHKRQRAQLACADYCKFLATFRAVEGHYIRASSILEHNRSSYRMWRVALDDFHYLSDL